MKRDMDAVRQIVLALRDGDADIHLQSLLSLSDEDFKYNGQLLIEAGLALGVSVDGGISGNGVIPVALILQRLTWEGHDFADSITDDTIWKKVKDEVLKPSGSWTFAIVKEYAKFEIKRSLGMGDT